MRDGGVYVFHIPMAPYRCPPGPYERVCQVADYFKRAKPKSKIIVLDSNPDITSKKGLFLQSWDGVYKGMIDYRPNSELQEVDAKTLTAKLTFDSVRADVLNVVPAQRAGEIAGSARVISGNQDRRAGDWKTCKPMAKDGVHVQGAATLATEDMRKSVGRERRQAKAWTTAVLAAMKGHLVETPPMTMHTS